MIIRSSVAGVLFGALMVACAPVAGAQTVAEFYSGKTIQVVVPFNPGGSTANFGQAVARHLGQYIPGNPAVTVEFMPGAGGLRGQNFAFNAAKKDGTVLLVPQDSVVVAQKLAPEGVQYDAKGFNWLGVAVPTLHVLMVRKDTGIKTIEDLKKKEIFIGSSGAGSETDSYPRVVNGLLSTKMKVVPGFPGGAQDVIKAIESNEMQGGVNGWPAWLRRPDLIAMMQPIVVFGVGRVPELPDVPNILELVKDPGGQQILKFLSSIGPIGRGFATPPGVPADRVAALREAYAKVMKDPKFLAEMKQINMPVDQPISGADAQKNVNDALAISPELVERVKKLVAVEN